ncbi:MAG: response regulator [Rhodothermales bacterium]|nr:response regulator [Rhodothermales bacterium]
MPESIDHNKPDIADGERRVERRASRGPRSRDRTDSVEQEHPEELPKLLAVEDNPEMLMLLKHLLSVSYEVHTGINMTTALEEIDANQFEVVLMDINLGTRETGVDVLHAIRNRPTYAETPVIAVTAYALPGDRERFLEEGFDAYIGKPFTRQQLFRLLKTVVPPRDS